MNISLTEANDIEELIRAAIDENNRREPNPIINTKLQEALEIVLDILEGDEEL